MIKNRKGFSFIELMMILAFFFIIMAALMPMITRRHLAPPQKVNHGTYACYRDRQSGDLKEILIKGRRVIIDQQAVDECHFEPPRKARYFYVQLIGGGGGGRQMSAGEINDSNYDIVNHIDNVHGGSYVGGYEPENVFGDLNDPKTLELYNDLVGDYKVRLYGDSSEGKESRLKCVIGDNCDEHPWNQPANEYYQQGEEENPSTGACMIKGEDVTQMNNKHLKCNCGSNNSYRLDSYTKWQDGNYYKNATSQTDCNVIICHQQCNDGITDNVLNYEYISNMSMVNCTNGKKGASASGYRVMSMKDIGLRQISHTASWNGSDDTSNSYGLRDYPDVCGYGYNTSSWTPYNNIARYANKFFGSADNKKIKRSPNGQGHVFYLRGDEVSPLLAICPGQGAQDGRTRGGNPNDPLHNDCEYTDTPTEGNSSCNVLLCTKPEHYKDAKNGSCPVIGNGKCVYKDDNDIDHNTGINITTDGKTENELAYEGLSIRKFRMHQTQKIPYAVGGRAGELKTIILKDIPNNLRMVPGRGGAVQLYNQEIAEGDSEHRINPNTLLNEEKRTDPLTHEEKYVPIGTGYDTTIEGDNFPTKVARGGAPGNDLSSMEVPINPYYENTEHEAGRTIQHGPDHWREFDTMDFDIARGGRISYSAFVKFIISRTAANVRDIMATFGEGGNGSVTKTVATCGYDFSPIVMGYDWKSSDYYMGKVIKYVFDDDTSNESRINPTEFMNDCNNGYKFKNTDQTDFSYYQDIKDKDSNSDDDKKKKLGVKKDSRGRYFKDDGTPALTLARDASPGGGGAVVISW